MDELTGLGSRREASRVLERNLEQGGAGAAVACDIDDLALFNETFGYVIADRALQAVARILASPSGRDGHYDAGGIEAFRMGGEEFLICLPGSDRVTALAFAEQARSEIKSVTAELVGRSAQARALTARFSVAAWGDGAAPGYHTLMLELDDALYKAGPDVVVLVEVRRGGH